MVTRLLAPTLKHIAGEWKSGRQCQESIRQIYSSQLPLWLHFRNKRKHCVQNPVSSACSCDRLWAWLMWRYKLHHGSKIDPQTLALIPKGNDRTCNSEVSGSCGCLASLKTRLLLESEEQESRENEARHLRRTSFPSTLLMICTRHTQLA